MNQLKNVVLIHFFALLMVCGSSMRAQNTTDIFDIMKDKLGDYIVLASQAGGECQQVETFAANGNMNRFFESRGSLSRSVSELALYKVEFMTRPVPDRDIQASLLLLVSEIEGDIRLWDAAQRANVQATGTIAANLREALDRHKGHAHEIRIAICCRM